MPSSPSSLGTFLLISALAAIPLACGGPGEVVEADRASASAAVPQEVVPPGTGPLIVLTGNEKGFIRPCGCSKPALGGIHRRATALEQLRAKEPGAHLVSVGNLVVIGGRQQRLKFETFLMSMTLMGYEALAPAKGEFALGVDYLLEMRQFGIPFVGLNVMKDGKPVFKDHVALGDGPYLVTGLISELKGVDGVTLVPANEALEKWLGQRDAVKDEVIVLFDGERPDAEALAATIPEAWRDRLVIVFGGSFDGPFEIKAQVPVLTVGSKGRFLAYLRPESKPLLGQYRLEEEIKGQPDVSAMLEGYRASLADEKLVENLPRRPIELAYMGDASCVECHEESCKALDPTPHERAWASLKATNDHHDPECAGCHVTGWAESTGFITEERTPKLVNVTCEACHGPCEDHNNVQSPTPNGKLGKQFCVRCHDADNSPKFNFDTYWPKIAHPPEGK